ncbi:MAG: spore cortex-lytic enzyme [Bacillota bacterium]|jgi:N-acetylmuramoyl-L-alanine amidase
MSCGQNKKHLRFLIGLVVLFCIIGFGSSLIVNHTQSVEVLTLKSGNQGQAVREVQQKLKQWGYYNGSVDGVFGSRTRSAVISFQKKNSLTADGVVGNATFKALGLMKYVSGSSYGSYNNDDVTLLARAIHAEAEGEPYIGKVAVGSVLLNRINSSDFPNTLSGVIYQSLALESVANGRFNSSANSDSMRAAREAVAGHDPTYGCLYFWNPQTATSAWIWTRKIVVQYGKHVFGI